EPLVEDAVKAKRHFPSASLGNLLKKLHVQRFDEPVLKTLPHHFRPGHGAELLFGSAGGETAAVELRASAHFDVRDQMKSFGFVLLLPVIPPGVFEFEGGSRDPVER